MRADFINALAAHQKAFDIKLSDICIGRLADYYDLAQEHNPLLHLVAPCSAEEFAVRHILESLTLLKHLPKNACFADVGTGAGLPSIPCLLARDDLSAVLIESKIKKARFLENAAERLDLRTRAVILDRQFEETDISGCGYVTCRALERFTERLSRLIRWSKGKKMLLLGGPSLETALTSLRRTFRRSLIPMSRQRYLFIVEP